MTDSISSMDGDVADLTACCDAANRIESLVIIDEARMRRACWGRAGRGWRNCRGWRGVDVTVGTLSTRAGSVGEFARREAGGDRVAGRIGRGVVFMRRQPRRRRAQHAAAGGALKIVGREPGRRERVCAMAGYVRRELVGMGFDYVDSATPIVPVVIGDAGKALRAAEMLRERGIFVPAIRPPTVAPKTARLRLSLMATHTDGQVERLLEAMRELAPGLIGR